MNSLFIGSTPSQPPIVLSPPSHSTEEVFTAEAPLDGDLDEEDIADIFGDEAQSSAGNAVEQTDLPPCSDKPLEDIEGENCDEDDLQGAAHKILPDPGEPTAAEVEEYRARGHVPFRSWCNECVECRGVGEPNRTCTE